MELSLGNWMRHSTGTEINNDDIAETHQSAVDAEPYNGVAKNVLESVGEIATTLKPGTKFKARLEGNAIGMPTVELRTELAMEKDNHRVLLVETVGAYAVWQVCSISHATNNAAD